MTSTTSTKQAVPQEVPQNVPQEVRVAELLQLFARAGDFGSGQPAGHVFRTCLIALRIAEEMNVTEAQRQSIYETALLMHGGCTAGSALFASFVACDELKAMREMCLCDPDSVVEVLRWVGANVGAGAPLPQRVQRVMTFLSQGPPAMGEAERGCADVGARIGERLALSDDAVRGLREVCERWNGKGPRKLQGAHIALPARVVHAAMIIEIFFSESGRDAAISTTRARRGKAFDPNVVDAFLSIAQTSSFWDALSDVDDAGLAARVLESEPTNPPRRLSTDNLDDVAFAIADFADLKSPATAAHSRATAALATSIATRLGLSAEDVARVRQAALIHDMGMVGVPSFLLQKPERERNQVEREQIAMHVVYTERLLARISALTDVAAIASAHHERIDGSGSPRGLQGDAIPRTARVLAVADAYDEATRHGLSPDDAVAAVRAERGLDAACVDALAALTSTRSGDTSPAASPPPAGLSERELEVFRLIAGGLTVKETAARLFLSAHTVRHHLEHVYEKIGVTTRAAAVLYAMERGLLK